MSELPHVSRPTAGLYKMRLVKGGPWCPVRVWHGFGADPAGGEPRGMFCWRAEINGREERIDRAWPWCAGQPIPQAEYDYLLALHRHAVAYEPALPQAAPRSPINLRTMQPILPPRRA